MNKNNAGSSNPVGWPQSQQTYTLLSSRAVFVHSLWCGYWNFAHYEGPWAKLNAFQSRVFDRLSWLRKVSSISRALFLGRMAQNLHLQRELPGRLCLGGRNSILSDWRCVQWRWQGSFHLGHLFRCKYSEHAGRKLQLLLPKSSLPHQSGSEKQGRHRQRCNWQLPYDSDRPCINEGHGLKKLQIQHRMATYVSIGRVHGRSKSRSCKMV